MEWIDDCRALALADWPFWMSPAIIGTRRRGSRGILKRSLTEENGLLARWRAGGPPRKAG